MPQAARIASTFLLGTRPESYRDLSLPVAIVEGEKKTLALLRLALYKADQPRFLPIGISGIWNWRGVNGRTINAYGKTVDTKGPIAGAEPLGDCYFSHRVS